MPSLGTPTLIAGFVSPEDTFNNDEYGKFLLTIDFDCRLCCLVLAVMDTCVTESESLSYLISTSRSQYLGYDVTQSCQRNERWRPCERVRTLTPYVLMIVPLAAKSLSRAARVYQVGRWGHLRLYSLKTLVATSGRISPGESFRLVVRCVFRLLIAEWTWRGTLFFIDAKSSMEIADSVFGTNSTPSGCLTWGTAHATLKSETLMK